MARPTISILGICDAEGYGIRDRIALSAVGQAQLGHGGGEDKTVVYGGPMPSTVAATCSK